jgi:hypothetical protein
VSSRESGSLWQVEVPEVRAGQWYFRQLFVDGRRCRVARSPNVGYHRIAALLSGPPDPRSKPVARDKFQFAPGDLQPWQRLADVHLVLMHSWETSIHPLKAVDMADRIVHFAAPLKEWWSIGYWEPAQRYYVENAFELLDEPGEWYLDRETGVLSYWPLPGQRMDSAETIAPRLTELVRLAGNADEGRRVAHVTLRGLAFHHADWVLAPSGNSSTQAAVEVPAAVLADGAVQCALERCEVAHVGTYGVWFRRGCRDCRIQANRLFDLGAGGIRVGEAARAARDEAESRGNLVDNNRLYDGGHVYAGAVGIWVAQSSHNRISHNDIHDFRYSGISIGWNWGLEPNRTHHNVVEFNHVHDLVHGQLSDAGLIYCLGVSPGSVIRNNVFALSATHALWPYSEKRPSSLRRNIVYLTQGQLLIPHGERSLNERLAAGEPPGDWDENLYWHTAGPDALRFYRRRFVQWQALGLDAHSRIADPLFVDPAAGDFRLRPDSPALALGFQPLDISQVGLYGDPVWMAEARHAACPCRPLPSSLPSGATRRIIRRTSARAYARTATAG